MRAEIAFLGAALVVFAIGDLYYIPWHAREMARQALLQEEQLQQQQRAEDLRQQRAKDAAAEKQKKEAAQARKTDDLRKQNAAALRAQQREDLRIFEELQRDEAVKAEQDRIERENEAKSEHWRQVDKKDAPTPKSPAPAASSSGAEDTSTDPPEQSVPLPAGGDRDVGPPPGE